MKLCFLNQYSNSKSKLLQKIIFLSDNCLKIHRFLMKMNYCFNKCHRIPPTLQQKLLQEIPCKVFAHTKIDQVFFVVHPNKRMSIINKNPIEIGFKNTHPNFTSY